MKKEKLQAELERVQNRLAIWCVLTICFYVIAALRVLPFIHWLAWLSAGYCFFFAWYLALAVSHLSTS